jgi:hypothetical protein
MTISTREAPGAVKETSSANTAANPSMSWSAGEGKGRCVEFYGGWPAGDHRSPRGARPRARR